MEDFLYYISGIPAGRARFFPDRIEDERISPDTGAAEESRALPPEEFFHPGIHRLWRLDGGACRWTGERVTLGDMSFARHLSYGGGVVYAQLSSENPVDAVTLDGALIGFLLPSRNEGVTVVRPGLEACTNLRLWREAGVSPAAYTLRRLPTAMVPMADGVHLATDVILPVGADEKLSAILVRTCYNKNDNAGMWAKYARRGYAVVIQDVRGREASEGEWIPFVHEREDGSDTLDWIAAQPWSNGAVGMLGGSYLGYVQWAAAASGNPHLKALVSQVTAGSPFVDLPRRGGVFGSGILAWSFMIARQKTDKSAAVRADWPELLAHRPIRDIPRRALGESIPFFDAWMEHEDGGPFWDAADWSLHADKIDVPALYISGWFDDDGPGTTQAWAMNRRTGRANQRFLCGPWLHKCNSARKLHSLELPANALRYDLDLLYLRWFDRFLKGVKNGVENRPAVEYYLLGRNEWHTASAWPPKEVEAASFFLTPGEEARRGALSPSAPEAESSMSYSSDPGDPFPYLINVSENECAVPEDYAEAERRDDVLLFTGPVLEEELIIAGEPWVEFDGSCSRPDADWVVRLTDVGSDGSSVRLADGILRARYRRSFDAPELLTPGKREPFRISMTRIAHAFLPGHRVRLQIASGADNLAFPNSQTGARESDAQILLSAELTVFQGGKHPGRVVLPVLPGAALGKKEDVT